MSREKLEKNNLMVRNAELVQNENIFKQEISRKRDEIAELSERLNSILDEQYNK